jgi:hypothetical protein
LKRRRAGTSCAVVLLLTSTRAGAQQCSDCDCYHFPIPTKCESCCGVATGNIASVTGSNIVLSRKEPNGQTTTRAFGLNQNTGKNAVLKVGAPATVYYHKSSSVAAQVDVVEALKDLLLPGNEPDPPPPLPCPSVPPNALKAFLGTSLAYTTAGEFTVLRIKGIDVLRLRRTPNGIAILAKVFSEGGKVVAQIVDNRLYVNPGDFIRIERPDSHSLVAYDLHQRQVLAIRYLNPQSVRVVGVFHLPERPAVVINEDEILLGTVRVRHACVGESRTAFAFE